METSFVNIFARAFKWICNLARYDLFFKTRTYTWVVRDLNPTCLSSITEDFLNVMGKNKTTTQSFDMFENIWLIISVWLISTFDWLQDFYLCGMEDSIPFRKVIASATSVISLLTEASAILENFFSSTFTLQAKFFASRDLNEIFSQKKRLLQMQNNFFRFYFVSMKKSWRWLADALYAQCWKHKSKQKSVTIRRKQRDDEKSHSR